MWFNRHKKVERQIASGNTTGYWPLVWKKYCKDRLAVWAMRTIIFLSIIALTGDFIANEKPIYCKIKGEHHWPIFKSYLVNAGWGKWDENLLLADWKKLDYEVVLFPPIPYSYSTQDKNNSGFISPFEEQNISSWRYRHWLGTDLTGRDTAAGLIYGTRIALSVGIVAMFIASLIGIGLGILAGYFGDDQVLISRIRLILNLLGIILAFFFAFISRAHLLKTGGAIAWLTSIGIIILLIGVINLPIFLFKKIKFLGKQLKLPIDLIIMRLIEVIDAIPGLLLILAIIGMVRSPSIYTVMIIIGLIAWTRIARFVRAELLRIRSLDYIESAKALGISSWQIMYRHALPNALTPVLISIAFGIAGAILLEAFLSFIGLGIPPDQVSWGSMLEEARGHFSAWWLAVFPGIAIFITVLSFNIVGEGLIRSLDGN